MMMAFHPMQYDQALQLNALLNRQLAAQSSEIQMQTSYIEAARVRAQQLADELAEERQHRELAETRARVEREQHCATVVALNEAHMLACETLAKKHADDFGVISAAAAVAKTPPPPSPHSPPNDQNRSHTHEVRILQDKLRKKTDRVVELTSQLADARAIPKGKKILSAQAKVEAEALRSRNSVQQAQFDRQTGHLVELQARFMRVVADWEQTRTAYEVRLRQQVDTASSDDDDAKFAQVLLTREQAFYSDALSAIASGSHTIYRQLQSAGLWQSTTIKSGEVDSLLALTDALAKTARERAQQQQHLFVTS